MAYEPNAPDEKERSYHYSLIWLSACGTLFWVANIFIGMDNMLSAIFFGAMVGGPAMAAFPSRTDEYFRSLCNVAMRWMCGALAIYLCILFLVANGDLAYQAGYYLASGETGVRRSSALLATLDSRTLAIGLALAFHGGYTFAWAHDKIGS